MRFCDFYLIYLLIELNIWNFFRWYPVWGQNDGSRFCGRTGGSWRRAGRRRTPSKQYSTSVSCKCIICRQGSKGIRQWLINWCTSPMMIHKITASVNWNYWLKCLNTQLDELTNQNLLKSPKLLSQQIRKRCFKTLGTSVLNSTMSPLLPWKYALLVGLMCVCVSVCVSVSVWVCVCVRACMCACVRKITFTFWQLLRSNWLQGGRGHWAV